MRDGKFSLLEQLSFEAVVTARRSTRAQQIV